MKKFVREWIEGSGAMQTRIRTLTNWAYPTEEQTKLQLLKVIEKKPGAYGPHTLQYAIDRRKREIQWDFPANKYNLTFLPKWYSGNGIYKKGAMLLLDHTIGEYSAMTRIEGIHFKRLGFFQSKDDLKTLDDLKVEMDVN
jgi:hypothetical protein